MSLFVRGGIYYVADKNLTLPPEKAREVHKNQRPVLVVSTRAQESTWPIALVIPFSTSPKFKTRHCVRIPLGVGNLNKESWIRVPAVQPIAKEHLGSKIGDLPSEEFNLVEARLLEYLGFL